MWPNVIPPGLLGALGGGGTALVKSAGQPTAHRAIETAGGAVAGFGFGSLPELGKLLLRGGQRLVHSFSGSEAAGTDAMVLGLIGQGALRVSADRQEALARQAPSSATRLLHRVLEILLRFLAGVVAGALGGVALQVLLGYLKEALGGEP